MRLDKYLKVSRLIKRRTVANEACDHGLVEVNGKAARASYEVKVGDQITMRLARGQSLWRCCLFRRLCARRTREHSIGKFSGDCRRVLFFLCWP